MVKNFLLHHSIHKRIVPFLDFIFLIRPTFYFLIWGVIVLGMITMNLCFDNNFYWDLNFSIKTLAIFSLITLLIGSAFIIMQIDPNNNPYSLLEESFYSLSLRQSISNKLFIFSIIMLLFLNWLIAVSCFCIFYLLGISFKQKPINWHYNPYVACLIFLFISILLYFIGCLIVFDYSGFENFNFSIDAFIFRFLSYVFTFSSIILLIIINDMKNGYLFINQKDGKFFNELFFLISPLFLISISLVVSLSLNDPLLSTANIVFFPFFIFSGFRRFNKDIIRSIRYPIFIINFFALSYFPWYSIPLLITYYLSKYYYWHRFNWHYPTFLVEDD